MSAHPICHDFYRPVFLALIREACRRTGGASIPAPIRALTNSLYPDFPAGGLLCLRFGQALTLRQSPMLQPSEQKPFISLSDRKCM